MSMNTNSFICKIKSCFVEELTTELIFYDIVSQDQIYNPLDSLGANS